MSNYYINPNYSQNSKVPGQRLYQNALRLIQKKNKKIRQKNDDNKIIEDPQCTFRPNIKKTKYQKFLNPPSKKTISFDPPNRSMLAQYEIYLQNKNDTKQTVKKNDKLVKRLYEWDKLKSQKLKQRFLEKQMKLSHSVENLNNKQKLSNVDYLNQSLQSLSIIKGTDQFFLRQSKASAIKKQKVYLSKFPSSYIWNYRQKFETKLDSTPIHYMDFGESRITRS